MVLIVDLMHFERSVKILLLVVYHIQVFLVVLSGSVLHLGLVLFVDHYIISLRTLSDRIPVHGNVCVPVLSYSSMWVYISAVAHVIGTGLDDTFLVGNPHCSIILPYSAHMHISLTLLNMLVFCCVFLMWSLVYHGYGMLTNNNRYG
jgi:hypothetical protein